MKENEATSRPKKEKKGKGGNPPHQPTEQTLRQAESMAGYGVPFHQIASLIGIDEKTLRKHYRKQLDEGKAKANSQVGLSLFQQAKAGNTAAAIWWTKSQMGWKDTSRVEVTGADGGAVAMSWELTGVKVTDPLNK